MWSKLSSLFIKQEKKTLSPEEVMDATIASMEEAIQKSTGSFNAAQKRKEELRKRLTSYEAKAAKIAEEATQALKQGEELLAKTILSRKTPLDIQIRDYQKVYDEVAATVYKLEIQLNKMKLQLEQTQAKKALLIAQLSQAESRKEMAQQLDELDISTDIFEEEIIHNQLDVQLQEDDFAQEQEALDQFDQKLAEANSLQQIQEKLAEEEKQRKAIEAKRLQKKLQLLFNNTKEKEQQVHKEKQEALAQKKQTLLQNFFTSTETQERHKNKALLEQFLEENESDEEQREEIKQALNDFEKTTTEVPEEVTNKSTLEAQQQQLLDNFFQAEEEEAKYENKALLEQFLEENKAQLTNLDQVKAQIEALAKEKQMDDEKSKQVAQFFKQTKTTKADKIDEFFKKK